MMLNRPITFFNLTEIYNNSKKNFKQMNTEKIGLYHRLRGSRKPYPGLSQTYEVIKPNAKRWFKNINWYKNWDLPPPINVFYFIEESILIEEPPKKVSIIIRDYKTNTIKEEIKYELKPLNECSELEKQINKDIIEYELKYFNKSDIYILVRI